MARGFGTGLLHGIILGGGALVALSLLMPQPPQATATATAPETVSLPPTEQPADPPQPGHDESEAGSAAEVAMPEPRPESEPASKIAHQQPADRPQPADDERGAGKATDTPEAMAPPLKAASPPALTMDATPQGGPVTPARLAADFGLPDNAPVMAAAAPETAAPGMADPGRPAAPTADETPITEAAAARPQFGPVETVAADPAPVPEAEEPRAALTVVETASSSPAGQPVATANPVPGVAPPGPAPTASGLPEAKSIPFGGYPAPDLALTRSAGTADSDAGATP